MKSLLCIARMCVYFNLLNATKPIQRKRSFWYCFYSKTLGYETKHFKKSYCSICQLSSYYSEMDFDSRLEKVKFNVFQLVDLAKEICQDLKTIFDFDPTISELRNNEYEYVFYNSYTGCNKTITLRRFYSF